MTAAHYFMLVESIHNDYWFENPVFKDLLAKAGISNPLQVLDETQWPGLRGVNTLRMGENPIFTLVGHGYENLNRFEDRETIKPGRILIVSTKCGMYSFFNNEVKKAIEYAAVDSDEKNVLFNKLFSEDKVQSYAALKSIETAMDISGLRMYRSGDKYPSIMFELDEVIKSGLFLNPIKKEDFLITGGIHGNYAKPESDESYFANAVYPTHDGVEWSKKILTPIVGSGQSIIKKAIDLQIFRISLSTLMDTYGPGVYIFPGCRDIKELQTDRKKIQEAGIFHKNIVKESRQYYNRTRTGIVNDETRKFLSILKPQIKQIILTRQLSNLQQKTIHGIKNATPAGGAGVSTRRTHKRGRRTRRKQRIGFK
jgi:hypothetical protein